MVKYDAVVIGGGFFGASVAIRLKKYHQKVLIVETENDLMQRASFNNQARVHGGYHYPRSLLTAMRSRVNFKDFTEQYAEAVDGSYDMYYGVANKLSKVSAKQFYEFCKRIGSHIETASDEVRSLFSEDLIEDVFKVQEYAFNAVTLKELVAKDINKFDIDCNLGTKVESVHQVEDLIELRTYSSGVRGRIHAEHVYNCTYAGINAINKKSSIPLVPMKYELAEMALVKVPKALQNSGFTVMCGPFFSLMPFPSTDLHTLSHVRYTPHVEWTDESDVAERVDELRGRAKTAFTRMKADSQRYMPCLKDLEYKRSLWEIKTILKASEQDDSRPIFFKRNHGITNYGCLMGAKIDNIQDVLLEIDNAHAPQVAAI